MRERYVVFRQYGIICMTPESNYNATIRDDNKVLRLRNFNSFYEVIKQFNDIALDDFINKLED